MNLNPLKTDLVSSAANGGRLKGIHIILKIIIPLLSAKIFLFTSLLLQYNE